jgi:hypothetical protein
MGACIKNFLRIHLSIDALYWLNGWFHFAFNIILKKAIYCAPPLGGGGESSGGISVYNRFQQSKMVFFVIKLF